MKRYLAILGFMAGFGWSEAQGQGFIDVKVIEVLDGDTLLVPVYDNSEILKQECFSSRRNMPVYSVRVHGVDTPETKLSQAKCVKEVRLGLIAKAYVKSKIKPGDIISIDLMPGEKYSCRSDYVVKYGPLKTNLADDLIKKGLARPYQGEKKGDWCN